MVILAQLVLVHKRHIRHTCLRLGWSCCIGWSGQAPPKLKNFDSLVDILGGCLALQFCMAASKYIYHLSHLSTDVYFFFCWLGQQELNGSFVKGDWSYGAARWHMEWNHYNRSKPPEYNEVTMVSCFLLFSIAEFHHWKPSCQEANVPAALHKYRHLSLAIRGPVILNPYPIGSIHGIFTWPTFTIKTNQM